MHFRQFRKGGTVSKVSQHCRTCAQRLRREGHDTPSLPGSRKRAPWILRSKRGSPQFTHEEHCSGRSGLRAPVRRLSWNWRVLALRAKTAAFPHATARCSPEGGGVHGAASCRTPHPLPTACRHDAARETYPPAVPLLPMPP